MPINQTELVSAAQQLAENQNLQVTVKESLKGACIAGGGALVGGVLGGPMGLAIGGTVGSICAAWRGAGKYKSVALVIMEDMTPRQREQLAESLQRALQDVDIQDVAMLTGLLMSNTAVQTLVIKELTTFLRNEMGLAIAA